MDTTYTLSGATIVAETSSRTLAGIDFNTGVTTVTWTVYDAQGNNDFCSFDITVTDNELPTLTCIADDSRNTDAGECDYTVVGAEFDLTGAGDNCGVVDTTYTLSGATIVAETSSRTLAGIDFNTGVTTVTWTVYDAQGNNDFCSFDITVTDNELPTLTCIADDSRNTDAGECDYTVVGVEFDLTGAGDNCGVVDTTYTLSGATIVAETSSRTLAGIDFNTGVTTVTWTVYDAQGNNDFCSFDITVTDNELPTLTCIADDSRNTDAGECDYTVVGAEFDLTGAGDNCGVVDTTYTLSGATVIAETSGRTLAGIDFNTGVTTVTWTVYDAQGNNDFCSFDITVTDNELPTLTCIADDSRNTDAGECDYTVVGAEFDLTGAGDNCGVVDTTYTLSGATIVAETSSRTLAGIDFNTGVTTVTWTVYDAQGNNDFCSFDITVTDNELPTLTCIADDSRNTDAGECDYTVVGAEFDLTGAGDNCGVVDTTYTLSGATIVAETSSRTLAGIDFNTGVTTVTWTVYDAQGNNDFCSFDITVTDNELPTPICKDITVYLDSITGLVSITVDSIDNGSIDNCGIADRRIGLSSQSTFGCNDIGPHDVYLVIEDNSGNIDSCLSIVTVEYLLIPDAYPDPEYDTICNTGTTNILLRRNLSQTTFRWTVEAPASISGAVADTAKFSIIQTLTNSSDSAHLVKYIINPFTYGCENETDTAYIRSLPGYWMHLEDRNVQVHPLRILCGLSQ